MNLGTAFVTIKPDVAGFRLAADAAIKSQLAGVDQEANNTARDIAALASAFTGLGDSQTHAARDGDAFIKIMEDSRNASALASKVLGDTNKVIKDTAHVLGDVAPAAKDAEKATGLFGGALDGMGQALGDTRVGLGIFSASIQVLPVVVPLAIVAIVALTDAIGSLIAISFAFLGPLAIVSTLLGGLGLAFILAGKRAIAGGGGLEPFAKTVAVLGSMFQRTTRILADLFLPYLDRLASAAKTALSFIDQIAQMPLAEAFHTLSTRGARMLGDFIDAIAHVAAKPIRLAFKFAFSQGSTLQHEIADWWDRLKNFLFGYTAKSPIDPTLLMFGKGKGKGVTVQHVDGIFQPLIDWFNRHNFTKEGQKIGQSIRDGFLGSGASQAMGKFLVASLVDAGKIVGKALVNLWVAMFTRFRNLLRDTIEGKFVPIVSRAVYAAAAAVRRALGAAFAWVRARAVSIWASISNYVSDSVSRESDSIRHALGAAWDWVRSKATSIWQSVKNAASGAANWAGNSIKNAIGGAFDWVVQKAQGIWSTITGIFSKALSVHINFPSLPSWAHLAGGTDNWRGGATWVGEQGPEIAYLPPGTRVVPHQQSMRMAASGAGGGGHTYNMYIQAPSDVPEAMARHVLNAIARRAGA